MFWWTLRSLKGCNSFQYSKLDTITVADVIRLMDRQTNNMGQSLTKTDSVLFINSIILVVQKKKCFREAEWRIQWSEKASKTDSFKWMFPMSRISVIPIPIQV